MKKIQCTGCGQIFWTELQLDETLVSRGEWVQNPCPKCGALWAVVEPGGGVAKAKRGRKAKPGPKRRGRPSKTVHAKGEGTPVKEEEGAPEMSASGIRKLRKKLGISQKKLGSLVGVSTATVVSWEKGKFKPRKDKVVQLSDLSKKGKEDVGKLLEGDKTKQVIPEKSEEGKREAAPQVQRVEKPRVTKGKRKGKEKK